MERILDKLTLFVLTALLSALYPSSIWLIGAGLIAISVSALFDVDNLPSMLRVALICGYVLAGSVETSLLLFLPLICYDCFRLPTLLGNINSEVGTLLRFCWVFPLLVGLGALPPQSVLLIGSLGALGCLRAWQSNRLDETLALYRTRRDELAALSQALDVKARNMEERQSLELRLVTLAERSRIAREIHDNVGHMLTRSILQVEALQVLRAKEKDIDGMGTVDNMGNASSAGSAGNASNASNAGNPSNPSNASSAGNMGDITEQLTSLADGLREAYQSVRQSVHGLHDEAFELHTQLLALIQETENLAQNSPTLGGAQLKVTLNYDMADDPLPPAISYSLMAIIKEALANSLKHSDADLIKIELVEFPGFYQLIIQDNGTKQPKQDALRNSGMGLVSMEERTRALGGVLNFGWDGGFKVFASIPKGGLATPCD